MTPRRWMTFGLVFVALSGLLAAALMVSAVVVADYGKAGFNLALFLVNAASFTVIANARADS